MPTGHDNGPATYSPEGRTRRGRLGSFLGCLEWRARRRFDLLRLKGMRDGGHQRDRGEYCGYGTRQLCYAHCLLLTLDEVKAAHYALEAHNPGHIPIRWASYQFEPRTGGASSDEGHAACRAGPERQTLSVDTGQLIWSASCRAVPQSAPTSGAIGLCSCTM